MKRISPTSPPPSLRKLQDGKIYLCLFADQNMERGVCVCGRHKKGSKLLLGKYPEKEKKKHNKNKKSIKEIQVEKRFVESRRRKRDLVHISNFIFFTKLISPNPPLPEQLKDHHASRSCRKEMEPFRL